ncbi:MAG: N-6 DNA methylase [Pyrinomonadaceae bacterium]|nr:N-6 DNA methylase [Pyrinomonadaceae bacterium]
MTNESETKTYLNSLSSVRRSGSAVRETSFYGTLENLLNEIGKTLKPKVRCVINLQNRGAGLPDGGFFTPDQFQKSSNELIKGQPPARGAIEIKGTSDDVRIIADTNQVNDYLRKYRQVLVTNYRDFLLVRLDENDRKQFLESLSIGKNEKDFWQIADNPQMFSETRQERFAEFLKRVMLSNAPITKPEDVAWFLASYARDAKARIEETELAALDTIRKALEDALGITFEGEKGENFFRSTLVQTLFYGIFSAWVLWQKRRAVRTGNAGDRAEQFNWRTAVWELRVPMISVLFEQIATPSNLKNLNLVEVLDWTEHVLNRVQREKFFASFAEDNAVQYFYEPFLEAFDPDLRKELGVWYTPPEIVKYMVERVDRVLREELGLLDGLADESVFILDPACGTGAYLVEVLRRINRTLEEKGEDATRGQKIKSAVASRVFGFEILPAPFVVSHLQIGLLLEKFGIGLSAEKGERAGVFLTNSLTGWEEHPKKHLPFPEFEEERDRADEVKKKAKILVVLGNPPYNAFAGVSPEEENNLVEPYKLGLIEKWRIKKFNLDDLYIRFFRLAERKIAELEPRKGIVCYISNFSYLSDPSFVVMREKFLSEFDKIWIDCLNGDSRETGKTTPNGEPDPSIFSTDFNKAGIRVGTAVGLFVRKNEEESGESEVRFRHFWGRNKREELLESLDENEEVERQTESNFEYEVANPEESNRFNLIPSDISKTYYSWIKLNDLAIKNYVGLEECRGGALIDIDKEDLIERMENYFDNTVSWGSLKKSCQGLTKNMSGFNAFEARKKIIKEESFDEEKIVKFSVRPFDIRFCFYSLVRPLWNRSRPNLLAQMNSKNWFLVSRFNSKANPDGNPICFSKGFFDKQMITRNPSAFPIYLFEKSKNENQDNLFGETETSIRANLSKKAREYLQKLDFTDVDAGEIATETGETLDVASLIWFHALAIGYSSEYLAENEDGIRQDFPRIPLPAKREDLIRSALLGKRVADLLDTEKQVAGITAGKISEPLRIICVPAHIEGLQFQDDDFRVTANWGYGGKNGIKMPGKGKTYERDYTQKELAAFAADGDAAEIMKCLGEKTFDVYLNETAFWRNVPERAWNYYIGGYQVLKKWLSYREYNLLGRALKLEEITEVTNMIRRISAILLLEPHLNENYRKIKAD